MGTSAEGHLPGTRNPSATPGWAGSLPLALDRFLDVARDSQRLSADFIFYPYSAECEIREWARAGYYVDCSCGYDVQVLSHLAAKHHFDWQKKCKAIISFLCVSNPVSFPAISMALSSTIGLARRPWKDQWGSVSAASEEARWDAFCPFQLAGVIAVHNGAIVLSSLAGTRPSEVPRKPLYNCEVGNLGAKLAVSLVGPLGHASVWPGRHVWRCRTETALLKSTAVGRVISETPTRVPLPL